MMIMMMEKYEERVRSQQDLGDWVREVLNLNSVLGSTANVMVFSTLAEALTVLPASIMVQGRAAGYGPYNLSIALASVGHLDDAILKSPHILL